MAPRAAARARAIEGFANDLARLREGCGRPSFRAMAARSRAISHTTLHEASQGHRLPSWETTVEYVRACGGDPADFRARWECAHGVVAAGRPQRSTDDAPPPTPPTGPAPEPVTEAARATRRPLVGVLAVAGVVTLALGVDATARLSGAQARPWAVGSAATAPAPTPPGGCEGSGSAAVAAARRTTPGMLLVADVTIPDCATVAPGVVRTKTWRLRNTGSRPWTGYLLRRLDQPQHVDDCQSVGEVPVPATAAGSTADVSVAVTVPSGTGSCDVRFAVVDARGAAPFPDNTLRLRVRVG
ncbi:MAG: hypothetical protein IE926_00800 [Micrococcales bacterium]|nr:hypothetical protein [Micrococcales bacterium]